MLHVQDLQINSTDVNQNVQSRLCLTNTFLKGGATQPDDIRRGSQTIYFMSLLNQPLNIRIKSRIFYFYLSYYGGDWPINSILMNKNILYFCLIGYK